jgi:mannose/fructose/N-acetylgalactosamine-specific phosphotransferase system component IIC
MALIGVILGFGIGILVAVGYDLLIKIFRKNKLKSKKSKNK